MPYPPPAKARMCCARSELRRSRGLQPCFSPAIKAGEACRRRYDLNCAIAITAHVQEAHMVCLHALTGLIEAELFPVA